MVCGESVETPHVLLRNGDYTAESGPFHDKCLTLTMKMCPHIVNDDSWTREVETMEEFMSNISRWYAVNA
jgi:hypothetical protein